MIRCFLKKTCRFTTIKRDANKFADVFNDMLKQLNIKIKPSDKPEYKKQTLNPDQRQKDQNSQGEKKKNKSKVNRNIKLKPVRDEKTFENPAGEINTAYYKNYAESEQKIAKHNQKAMKAYLDGEKNIEKREIDYRYVHKITQLFKIVALREEEQKLSLDINTINRDSDKITFKVNRYKKEFDEKEQEGDVEQFWAHVEAYPGSRFGPLPQDDPESFFKYIKGRVPASFKEKYRQQTGQSFLKEEDDIYAAENSHKQQIENSRQALKRTPISFRSILSSNRYPVEDEFLGPKDRVAGTTQTFIVKDEYLPAMPQFQLRDYQSNWQVWLLWQKFRYFYNVIHANQIFVKAQQLFQQIDYSRVQIKPLGSLYNYYKTLPQFLQDHEGVRTVYLGLEYKSPEWSTAEKEQALNKAASMCLPLEEACQVLLTDHLSLDKWRLSAYEMDRLFNIKPQFTYDIEDFYNEIKEEKLRGQKTGDNKHLAGYELEERIPVQKSPGPSLPVDFYDNKDGFWDGHIKHKMNNQAPVMIGRKYLKH